MSIEERCNHYMIEHLGTLVNKDRIIIYKCWNKKCNQLLSPYTMGGTIDIENYKPTSYEKVLRYEPHECMNPSRAIGLT